MAQYRQGDLLIEKVNVSVNGKKVRKVTLALGEVTGHSHVMVCDRDMEVNTEDAEVAERLIHTTATATITHQEHSTITVPPGTYRITRQREWTDAEEPIRVAD